jgi:hypothetical protein
MDHHLFTRPDRQGASPHPPAADVSAAKIDDLAKQRPGELIRSSRNELVETNPRLLGGGGEPVMLVGHGSSSGSRFEDNYSFILE